MKLLAECLLRRKELSERLARMGAIRSKDLFETRVSRVKVTDNIDEVTAGVAKVDFAEFDKEYNNYASQLRRIDAAIQQMNWTVNVDNVDECFID